MIFCEELMYSSGVMGSSKALTIATAASLPIRPSSLDLISQVYALPPYMSETCWVVAVYTPSVSACVENSNESWDYEFAELAVAVEAAAQQIASQRKSSSESKNVLCDMIGNQCSMGGGLTVI